jgi:hypothetical protein
MIFEGSTYFFHHRDQSLAGKNSFRKGSTASEEKLADFTAQTYGVERVEQ